MVWTHLARIRKARPASVTGPCTPALTKRLVMTEDEICQEIEARDRFYAAWALENLAPEKSQQAMADLARDLPHTEYGIKAREHLDAACP